MGDMADMSIEEINRIYESNAYDPEFPPRITCKYCGKISLHWERTKDTNQWRLFDDQLRIHLCRGK